MSSWAINSSTPVRWSWMRIGGFSGTVLVHVFALALLAIPVALPSYRPDPPEFSIRWIETPPEPVLLPIPDEPVPLPRPQVTPEQVAAPIPAPDLPMQNVVSAPVNAVAVPAIASTVEPTSTMTASTNDVSLDYESIVRPKYPMTAVRRGEQGTVLLRVTVGRDGLPTRVEIARSSGYFQLDKEAREAVLRWRFRPVRINGTSVTATGLVPIEFELGKH